MLRFVQGAMREHFRKKSPAHGNLQAQWTLASALPSLICPAKIAMRHLGETPKHWLNVMGASPELG
jgi:hypothetical protein